MIEPVYIILWGEKKDSDGDCHVSSAINQRLIQIPGPCSELNVTKQTDRSEKKHHIISASRSACVPSGLSWLKHMMQLLRSEWFFFIAINATIGYSLNMTLYIRFQTNGHLMDMVGFLTDWTVLFDPLTHQKFTTLWNYIFTAVMNLPTILWLSE